MDIGLRVLGLVLSLLFLYLGKIFAILSMFGKDLFVIVVLTRLTSNGLVAFEAFFNIFDVILSQFAEFVDFRVVRVFSIE